MAATATVSGQATGISSRSATAGMVATPARSSQSSGWRAPIPSWVASS